MLEERWQMFYGCTHVLFLIADYFNDNGNIYCNRTLAVIMASITHYWRSSKILSWLMIMNINMQTTAEDLPLPMCMSIGSWFRFRFCAVTVQQGHGYSL